MADAFKLYLFQDLPFADVTFVFDNREVEAHKCVLTESCDYFKKLFDTNKCNRFLLKETPLKAFNEVIKYCYLQTIDVTQWFYREKKELENLAKRYKYQPLIELMEKELDKYPMKPVSVSSLNEWFEMRPPEEISEWVKMNLVDILDYRDSQTYTKDLIVLIVDSFNKIYDMERDKHKLRTLQKKVFNWLFRWRNSSKRTEEEVESIFPAIIWTPMFIQRFRVSMETTQEGKTNQFTPKEILAMLHFWRYREVDTTGWTCEQTLQLLVLANAYNFGPFSDALQNIVGTQYLEIASLVAIHDTAFKLDSSKLKQIIADYIKNNTMDILSSAEFTNYSASVVEFIMDNLKSHAMDTKTKTLLLTYVWKWMTSKSEEEVKVIYAKIRWNDFAREEVADFFKNLLKDDDTKDVTFVVDGNEIKAHKRVLAFSCKHFEQLFNETKENRIIMQTTSFKVFKEVVNYCYFEKIDITQWYYREKKNLYNWARECKYQSLMELVKSELKKPSEVPFRVETLNTLYGMRPPKEIRQWVRTNIQNILSNVHCSHYSKDLVEFIMETFYQMYDNSKDKRGLKGLKRIVHPWLFQWINSSNRKDYSSVFEKIRWDLVPYQQKAFLEFAVLKNNQSPEQSRGTKRKHE